MKGKWYKQQLMYGGLWLPLCMAPDPAESKTRVGDEWKMRGEKEEGENNNNTLRAEQQQGAGKTEFG